MKNSRLPKLLNSQQKKAILAMLLGGSILATPTAFAAGSTLIVGVASIMLAVNWELLLDLV